MHGTDGFNFIRYIRGGNKIKHSLMISLCTFFIFNSVVFGTDRLVPSVYSTIQAGIDAAGSGDRRGAATRT